MIRLHHRLAISVRAGIAPLAMGGAIGASAGIAHADATEEYPIPNRMLKTSCTGDRHRLANRTVWRVGYGAMQLAGPGVFGPPRDHDEAIAVLRTAIDAGVDHIDTAHYYGPAVVNELIRETLSPYPDDLALVSKVGGRRDERGAFLPYNDPDQLRTGIEDNLATLGVETH
jgi:hypothetical protein